MAHCESPDATCPGPFPRKWVQPQMHEFDASQWNSTFRMRTTLRQDKTHQLMWENRSPKAEHGVKVLKILEIATFHPTHTRFPYEKYISLLTLKGLWLPTRAATEMIKGSQGANWRMECMSSREFLRANAHKLSQPPRAPSHSPEYTMFVERTCVDPVLMWLPWLCWHKRPTTNLIWYAINNSFVRNNCFDIHECRLAKHLNGRSRQRQTVWHLRETLEKRKMGA